MTKLNPCEYHKVMPLITSRNEITVFSALEDTIDNEVFVDNADFPTSVLLKIPGKNYVAGNAHNKQFNAEVSSALDFWDQLTPDNDEWSSVASECHPNQYIRLYKRRRYGLHREEWKDLCFPLSDGYVLESINLPELRNKNYINANKIYEWTSDYKDDENFMAVGVGTYARPMDAITNWSMSDGHFKNKIAIGVLSEEAYRKKGLSIAASAATVKECFARGFSSIDWLCVDFNKGSRAVAEKLGFRHVATYDTFTSYPPCENLLDLSDADWNDWGVYYENVTPMEPRLLGEQLSAYVKANNVEKAMKTILYIEEQQKKSMISDLHWIKNLPGMISYFQSIGMCSSFAYQEWKTFVEKHDNVFDMQE